ncbi:tRNA (guanine(46)-N(7))-methyltransferase TrmB [Colwellia sp. C1TZA3]|uniref:tRNA (guanine(46)-N(7))-methyltransferase TrmB n=1 Tax=Colwellia sp. C1TZA3 TaxID=2508879 RepID=UPI0011B970D3|nr:SAM-dependent methyltransferase [Colwellia sp. C1TZA3]TWX72639.1 SAM-dependent methyltransferase [Colwellia sp. C1TZA3]
MSNTEITGDSRMIETNQPDMHEKLVEIVHKHIAHPSQKPIQAHTQQAFDEINHIVQAFSGEVILDSCCGVGQSTRLLAKQNPDALVIGIDKSAHRINRNVDEVEHDDGQGRVENYHLIRADLNDFYRLVVTANWQISQHYILYPNPWPKAKHVQRRWHGSAVFPQIIAVGQEIILRSNWRLYLEEFQLAASIFSLQGDISAINDAQPLTPFEAKYQASGQQCWQLRIFK